jgi:hypothetical protein
MDGLFLDGITSQSLGLHWIEKRRNKWLIDAFVNLRSFLQS